MAGGTKIFCRTCLMVSENMFSLFAFTDPKDISLVDMLMSCSSVRVDSKDALSKLICTSCINTLTVSYNFRKQCERSDRLLRSDLDNAAGIVEQESDATDFMQTTNEECKVSEDELSEHGWFGDVNKDISENKLTIRKFMCKLCDKRFIKPGNLKQHMTTHNDRNECTHCGVKCDSYEALIVHGKEHHRLFKCHMCDKDFSTGNALNGHMRLHKKISGQNYCADNVMEAEYICVVGEERIAEKTKCDKDEGKYIENSNTEVIAQMVEGESFNCTSCECQFVSSEELNAHSKVHESNYECAICELMFSKYDSLISHNKNVHNTFSCRLCTKSFATSYGLSGHMRHHVTVSKGSPSIFYKCTINNCARKFSSLDYLRRHRPSHYNGQKVFLCNLCGKTYNSNNSFYYHQKLHRNERPHVCSYCGNSYKLMCHLKSHMWIHTGQRPHECTKCGKRFTRSQVLKKHIETNCGSKKRRKLVNEETSIHEGDEYENGSTEIDNQSPVGEIYDDAVISHEIYVDDIDYSKDK